MVGIVLCTHGDMAAGMKQAAEMIIGPQEHFQAIGFYNGDDLECLQEKLLSQVRSFAEAGLVSCVLVDLLGASPFNASLSALLKEVKKEAYVITGVSLPLLLDILLAREEVAAGKQLELLSQAVETARENIALYDVSSMEL